IRAQRERLAQDVVQARIARDADPGNPELQAQYEQAQKAEADWANGPVKLVGKIFHELGMGLQEEMPVDTSTFDGLARLAREKLGRPLKPGEEFSLKKSEADQSAASGAADESAGKVVEALNKRVKPNEKMSWDDFRKYADDMVKDKFKDCAL